MTIKYLIIDVCKIPKHWDVMDVMDVMDYIKIMKVMNIPLTKCTAFKELKVNVTFWQWLKYKLFNKF